MKQDLMLEDFFDAEQVQNLVLAFVKSRKGKGVTIEETEAFLRACAASKFEGQALDLVAGGKISLEWDEGRNEFSFFVEKE